MPAGDISCWRSMALQLQQAADQQDWERVRKLDQLLVQWLHSPAFAGQAEHRQEQALLLQTHQQVLQACRQAREAAWQNLHGLEKQQEAQKAYAWQETLG